MLHILHHHTMAGRLGLLPRLIEGSMLPYWLWFPLLIKCALATLNTRLFRRESENASWFQRFILDPPWHDQNQAHLTIGKLTSDTTFHVIDGAPSYHVRPRRGLFTT